LGNLIVYSNSNSYHKNENDVTSYHLPEVNELEINLSQLKRNAEIIRGLLKPQVRFLAVLKGDAYGHGMIPVAYELEKCGCDAFGVVRLNEAVTLREAGIKLPVFLLAPVTYAQVPWIIKYDITVMADQEELITVLDQICKEEHKTAKVHIKINTGLNRYGINQNEAVSFIEMVHSKYSFIEVEGVYTHFQNPDYNNEMTKYQMECFDRVIKSLEASLLRPPIVHAAGTTGIFKYPQAHYDMVRCGVLLFGLEHTKGEKDIPAGILPLMTLKGRIIKIRTIKKGEYGGYGNAFLAAKDTRVAIIGLGYGDGVGRGWKEVLIAGRRVPVINYFMDGIMADVTELGNLAREFEEAVAVGTQGSETIDWGEVCKWFGTYEDEQIQRITKRVPKHYFYD
jgi:alanine racemase